MLQECKTHWKPIQRYLIDYRHRDFVAIRIAMFNNFTLIVLCLKVIETILQQF